MNNLQPHSQNIVLFQKVLFLLIIALGMFLRFDQFLLQTLMDDEWHAVNKLLSSSPAEIATSFGHADYSIPLTLFYWLESKLFGLSELMMRWPMMLIGLLTLILFPLHAKKNFSVPIVLVFAFFLAISPILIEYSRIARPYAVTLFLTYFSYILFNKIYHENASPILILTYILVSALAVWLHLIVVFFIAAPFVVEFIKSLLSNDSNKMAKLIKLLKIGIPTLVVICLLIVPPLMNDMEAISSKAGNNIPNVDTLLGFLHLCFGTSSAVLVTISSVFSLYGIQALVKNSNLAINVLTGFGLTLLVIFIVQPAWVHIPITFTRYVLPIVPLILLSTAIGIVQLFTQITKLIHSSLIQSGLIIGVSILLVWVLGNHSPLNEWLKTPNSNTLHSVFTIDYRKEPNKVKEHMQARSISPFWKTLQGQSTHQKIAVAPWFFESYNWDGPVWEKHSQRYVVPGMLIGLCVEQRKGEIPNNQQFKFKNLAYLSDELDLKNKNIGLIAYQKPERFKSKVNVQNLENCLFSMKQKYGSPIYDDELISVFESGL